MGEGRGVVGGAESYDGEKAWSSMNHLILSLSRNDFQAETNEFSFRVHDTRFVFGSFAGDRQIVFIHRNMCP